MPTTPPDAIRASDATPAPAGSQGHAQPPATCQRCPELETRVATLAHENEELKQQLQAAQAALAQRANDSSEADRALRGSEERFEQIARELKDVLYLMEPDHTITYVSPAYERVWGTPVLDVVKTRHEWLNFVHPDDHERVSQSHDRALADHTAFQAEYRILRRDGEIRWIRDRVFPAHDAAGRVVRYIGISEDVTESRQLEESLHHAQKMEAVGTLVSGVAHDFRNLLQGISACANMGLREQSIPERTRYYVENLLAAAQRGTALTDQLMAFSHRKDIQPRATKLDAVLDHAALLIAPLLGPQVQLRLELGCGADSVMADPVQLEQILMNLATNAADAMPNGGSLTIRTASVELSTQQAAELKLSQSGHHLRLQVEDTGNGMDATTRAQIFEPFFTTKGPNKGTGLGLATVCALTTKLGGRVAVASEPGHGTRFTFHFPRCAPSPTLPEPSTQPAFAVRAPTGAQPPPPREVEPTADGTDFDSSVQGTILVVEDNQAARIAIRDLFGDAGYRVLEAARPSEAITQAQTTPGTIDVLLTDFCLPEMDGDALATELQNSHPQLRVVFMSGLPDRPRRTSGTYLQKPIDLNVLEDAVQHALAARVDQTPADPPPSE